MDDTTQTQMVLGAIDRMTKKLDDLKDTVAEFITDSSSRLATLEQWKLTSEPAGTALEARVRALEQDRVTQAKLDELKEKFEKQQKEIATLREEGVAVNTRDRIWGAILGIAASGIVSLLVHYLTTLKK